MIPTEVKIQGNYKTLLCSHSHNGKNLFSDDHWFLGCAAPSSSAFNSVLNHQKYYPNLALLNSLNGPHSTLSLQASSPNLTFLLQTSNLVPKRGFRWFLTSSTTHCHMSVFTAFLAHFPIFELFSLKKILF